MTPTHTYIWGNNPKRAALKGQRCTIMARGRMRSVLVQWEHGGRDIIDWYALRKG